MTSWPSTPSGTATVSPATDAFPATLTVPKEGRVAGHSGCRPVSWTNGPTEIARHAKRGRIRLFADVFSQPAVRNRRPEPEFLWRFAVVPVAVEVRADAADLGQSFF